LTSAANNQLKALQYVPLYSKKIALAMAIFDILESEISVNIDIRKGDIDPALASAHWVGKVP